MLPKTPILWLLAASWTLVGVQLASGFTTAPARSLSVPRWLQHVRVASGDRRCRITNPTAVLLEAMKKSSMDGGSDSQMKKKKKGSSTSRNQVSTTANADFLSAEEENAKPPFPLVLWRFTRPHTIIGSAMAIPALTLLAAPSLKAALSTQALTAMLYAMVPALLMNLYITGLNQITDVEIDKINKPNLPIPAGHLSTRDATVTVVLALIASLALGVAHPLLGSPGLNLALWGSALLGTIYSLPPLRFKRFHLLAAFCIVAVRGFVINAAFFAHAKTAAYGLAATSGGAGSVWQLLATDQACWRSSLFFGVFGLVIALMKDVPDVVGDRISNILTFSVRVGPGRVFHAMRRLLTGLFLAVGASFAKAGLEAPTAPVAACRALTSVAAVLAGLSVRKEAQGVDPEDSKQVYSYYMHLWKLFYASYLVLPFAM